MCSELSAIKTPGCVQHLVWWPGKRLRPSSILDSLLYTKTVILVRRWIVFAMMPWIMMSVQGTTELWQHGIDWGSKAKHTSRNSAGKYWSRVYSVCFFRLVISLILGRCALYMHIYTYLYVRALQFQISNISKKAHFELNLSFRIHESQERSNWLLIDDRF